MEITPENIDIVGCWRLIAATGWTNGVMTNPLAMGTDPAGYIAYTVEGRVMVVLDRRSMGNLRDRFGSDPVFSYSGTYTRKGDMLYHHLDICTAVQDIGTDYVRRIEVDGDKLLLCTEPETKGTKTFMAKVVWVRDSGFETSKAV